MIIIIFLFLGSAISAFLLNTFWAFNGQDGNSHKYIPIVNGILLTIFFGSLLLMALTSFLFGV